MENENLFSERNKKSNKLNNFILTIAIPTYNRVEKLKRLLKKIELEVDNLELNQHIKVIVSNNCSKDNTEIFLSKFKTKKFSFQYYNQKRNLGFDGNIKFLYEKIKSDYIWFLSDDDIPLENSLIRILETLRNYQPDLLLFSFQQPPGSSSRQFNYTESIKLIES